MQVTLKQAVALLKNGQVVAIPTETVYGLAADATNDAALRQIFTIKQRPMDNPLIVHIASMSDVVSGLGESIAVLDGGACSVGIESTIVSVKGEDWQLLRLGMITQADLQRVTGKSAFKNDEKNTPKAPGQHLQHYSPTTPIRLFGTRKVLLEYVQQYQSNHAALLISNANDTIRPLDCEFIILPNQAPLAAAQLYSALHVLDKLNVDQILIELPPKTSEWLAVIDRLTRAAS